MSAGAVADLFPPTGAPSAGAAIDRVRRYLYEELGPSKGLRPAGGAGLARAHPAGAARAPAGRDPDVHVAGTAGKGPVVTFIAALIRAHGFRVGAHTSPHVYGGRPVVLDGAHDPMKLAALVATLQEVHPGARVPWELASSRTRTWTGPSR